VMSQGWRGAVIATYLTHIMMTTIVLAYLAAYRMHRRWALRDR
jgi:hypothetical protein